MVILLLLPVRLDGQSSRYMVKSLTTMEGLAGNTVYCILQDHLGFMWVGTDDGLCRYDGKSIKIYRNDPHDASSLSNSVIRCLLEDRDHNIWIGTRGGGLNRYDREHEAFVSFQYSSNDTNSISHQEIACLFEDRNGILWIGTDGGGLDRYEPQYSRFIRYNTLLPSGGGLSSLKVISMAENSSGKLLLGTWDGGLDVFNPSTGRVDVIKQGQKGLGGNKIWNIQPAGLDAFWIGLYGRGLQYYDQGIDQFLTLTLPDSLAVKTVYSIIAGTNHDLWLGTNAGLLHGTYGEIHGKPMLHPDFYRITSPITTSVMQDRNGCIWACTTENGLMEVWHKNPYLQDQRIETSALTRNLNLRVYEFAETKDGTIWLGTGSGLAQYNPHNRISRFVEDPNNTGRVYGLTVNHEGELLVGRDSDVSEYDEKRKVLKPYFMLPAGTMKQVEFSNILMGNDNDLWLGTGNGLYWVDLKSKRHKTIIPPGSLVNGQSLYQIRDLALDKDGNLVVATRNGGLAMKYKYSDSIQVFQNMPDDSASISSNRLNSMLLASDNTIWVTSNNGLDKFNARKGTFIHYSLKDGLPGKIIYSALEDHSGNLWLCGPECVSRFNPANHEVANFYFDDLNIRNAFFTHNAFQSASGRMYFARRTGFISFNPDSILPEASRAKLLITDFSLKTITDKRQDSKFIRMAGDTLQSVTLPYHYSSFSLSYTCFNYKANNRSVFYYRLYPLEKEWLPAGTNTTVNYTNIPAGEYRFVVKSINLDGVVNTQTSSLIIHIMHPYWQSWWFRLIMILIFLALIYLGFTIRLWAINREKARLQEMVLSRTAELSQLNEILEDQKEELMNNQVELGQHRDSLEKLVNERTQQLVEAKLKAEESDRLKSAFLANMSHEIRTPLNAIVGFSNLLFDEGIPANKKYSFKDIIESNSRSLLVLIDDILDLSKIEAGQLSLILNDFNPVDILREIHAEQKIPHDHEVQFRLGNLEDYRDIRICSDRIRFRQVLNNLISNGFKYTEKGFVEAGILRTDARMVTFYVKDTGIGIAEENKDLIFSRFWKKEDVEMKLYRGVGLGLTITRHLVELSGGTIWLESEVGQGTSFYFTQPLATPGSSGIEPEASISDEEMGTGLNGEKYIAVAEDNESNLYLLMTYLERKNFHMLWFRNGKEIADYFSHNDTSRVNLVLLDIKMPVMDGFEAAKVISRIGPGMKIIAVTAQSIQMDMEKEKYEIFDDVLMKPLSQEALANLLQKYLST